VQCTQPFAGSETQASELERLGNTLVQRLGQLGTVIGFVAEQAAGVKPCYRNLPNVLQNNLGNMLKAEGRNVENR
jgi:hypothetical protein